ncbi:MAG: glycosyltransferase family 39 protein [Candidatus Omnitrophota bacterium]
MNDVPFWQGGKGKVVSALEPQQSDHAARAKLFLPLSRPDAMIAGTLALGVFLLLFAELSAPGVTWDEASPNFVCAKNQAYWLSHLFALPQPFSQETIDKYWQTKSDHPSLPRTLAGISYRLFSGYIDEVTALRIPSALQFSLLIGTIYLFLREFLPKASAIAGALSLALMPRVFGHAHIFSLDAPIMCWWFWAAAAGFWALHGRLKPWIFGLSYAIAFTTKLHAAFLPFPLLAWALIFMIWRHEWSGVHLKRLAWAIFWAMALTFIIYIGVQPWLWHDTGKRIVERFFHLSQKATVHPINLFYLMRLYSNNTPWHYPLVMIFFTLPPFLLLLNLLGFLSPLWKRFGPIEKDAKGVFLFLALHFAAPILIVLLPLAQAYDGCRLFLPCFPFAACLCGFGFHYLWKIVSGRIPAKAALVVLFVLLVFPSAWTYLHIRPFYLAYYNEFAGGIAGAKELGMETTYWCDGLTRDFLREIDAIIPPGKTVKPCSMSFEVAQYAIDRGFLHARIGDPADFYLLQFRQGMFSEGWRLSRFKKPLAKVEVDGVPLFALYDSLE